MNRALLLVVPLLGGCYYGYGQPLPTFQPIDPRLALSCEAARGPGGRDPGLLVSASFQGGSRDLWLPCGDRRALVLRLKLVRDFWCDGLDVPEARVGGLSVGTLQSELTGKRGATLDDGEGFVLLHCGGWLEQLIGGLEQADCCGGPLAPPPKKGSAAGRG
ncbi:MAG: hypothetical protein HY744_27925 [Deltaproteobacteria bacterium]|nr:hypothetical protein [Deltaproteobacteria bacterium]